jgi:methanogenic corrinoid protein MtbC1
MEEKMGDILTELLGNLQEEEVLKQVHAGLDRGTDPQEILKACQQGMVLVGEKYEQSIYYVSDLMMAGEIFKGVSRLLSPHITEDSGPGAGRIVVGTVAGDIHDIGKDLVIGMLKANNFKVYDLGVDVKTEVFIDKLKETKAPVLALSGLLTVAFDSMKDVISSLETEGLRDEVKVMVGGGPVNKEVCTYTGADGWGADAQAAVKLGLKWIEG